MWIRDAKDRKRKVCRKIKNFQNFLYFNDSQKRRNLNQSINGHVVHPSSIIRINQTNITFSFETKIYRNSYKLAEYMCGVCVNIIRAQMNEEKETK